MTKLDCRFGAFLGAVARREIMVALLTSAFFACGLGTARSESYMMSIRQTLEQTSNALSLLCSDGGAELCRGTIKLSIEGHDHLVSVVALFQRGGVYLKFGRDGVYLNVGSQPYVYVPLGRPWPTERSILLYEPLPASADDPQNSLLHWPVIRGSTTAIAELDLEIQPAH